MSPSRILHISSAHATNASDVDFLKKLFRQTFRAVMGPAKNIQLMNVLGPPPAQWRLFLEVTLCECPRQVHVDLSWNEAITDATLQPFAALHGSLEYLRVGMSAGFRGQPRTAQQPPQTADVNKAAKAVQTPLSLASAYGHKDVVVTLLAAGADKMVEFQGWTALSAARGLGHREITALLA